MIKLKYYLNKWLTTLWCICFSLKVNTSRTSLRLGAYTSIAFLRIKAPSGINGGLSLKRQKESQIQKYNFTETTSCSAMIISNHLLVSLGGHGQVEPVENIVDLLALHLGVDTMGQEPVTGLRNTGPWTNNYKCNTPQLTDSESLSFCVSPLL